MVIPPALPAAVGVLAILATMAIFVVQAVLARAVSDQDVSVQVLAIIAAGLEALISVVLSWFVAAYVGPRAWRGRIKWFNGIWLGLSLLVCTVATTVSVVAVVCLSDSISSRASRISGSEETGFSVSSSVTLGVAFVTQLAFLVVHYISSRTDSMEERYSLHAEEGSGRSAPPHIKSIPYHQTSPRELTDRSNVSTDTQTPPGSSGGQSTAETRSSIARSVSSRTHLLPGSQRSSRRPPSLDFSIFREQSSSKEDSFDSWDTSAVDPQNRQTVLETSSPPASRFLETIPASPATSRSPSPRTPSGRQPLEPPRIARRSRSFSPSTPDRQPLRPTLTQHTTVSESHIHPLFRSDSPDPPPIATPGTIVVAAPNGGRIMSDRGSIRSLTRMRSGSLPATSSPLVQQSSFESFHSRKLDHTSPELREESEESGGEMERKLTPPIPEWILTAGSRSSLTDYKSRKLRSAGGERASDSDQSWRPGT